MEVGASDGSAARAAWEEEHMAARVVVGCTHGSENADAVTVSYLTAGAALDRGDEVVMWLTSEGVRLALDGYVNPIRAGIEPPVERIHRQFIEKGGRFYVCPHLLQRPQPERSRSRSRRGTEGCHALDGVRRRR